jgi:hypothetical protein
MPVASWWTAQLLSPATLPEGIGSSASSPRSCICITSHARIKASHSGNRSTGPTEDAAKDVVLDVSTDGASDAPSGPVEANHCYGRWNRLDASAITVNSGSHVTTTFHGTAIAAKFDTSPNQTTPANTTLPTLTWQIDGGGWKEGEIEETLSLVTGLTAGTHDVRLMVRRQNEFQSRWTPPLVASVTFRGFDVTEGAIDPTPRPIKRKVEFLGDSITEGVSLHVPSEVPKNTRQLRCFSHRALFRFCTCFAFPCLTRWRSNDVSTLMPSSDPTRSPTSKTSKCSGS